MKINEHASGRWPEIVSRLLGEQFANTRRHQACPATGETGKGTPRFRFSDMNGRGHFFCHCSGGEKDGFDLLMCVNGCDFQSAARQVESVIGECPRDGTERRKNDMAGYSHRLRGMAGKILHSQYLARRGLEIAPGLDWARDVDYFVDGQRICSYAGMLAPIVRDGKFLTYHVTYLQAGAKAPVTPCRKILPGGSNSGGACPLYPAAETMGIAEGIETAIAAKMLFGIPVWAALNTALLGGWKPPSIARNVTIFADNDASYAGHAAAYKLAHALHRMGINVEVRLPDEPDTDWADVLLQDRTAA